MLVFADEITDRGILAHIARTAGSKNGDAASAENRTSAREDPLNGNDGLFYHACRADTIGTGRKSGETVPASCRRLCRL